MLHKSSFSSIRNFLYTKITKNLLVASRSLLVDAVVSSLENSEFVEEVMLCEKKVTHLIIKKLK